MAIDHVRVYAGVPPAVPPTASFHTVDHAFLCAGVHFSCGTSAWFYGRNTRIFPGFCSHAVSGHSARVTVIAWRGRSLRFKHYELAGVIWVIGWSMIALAALSKLPTKAVAIFGGVVIATHNLLDGT